MKKLLVVVAHPDDEAFGMGGTIAKYSRYHEVSLQVMVSENKEFDLGNHDAGNKIDALSQSCEVLGIRNYFIEVGNQALMLDKEPIVRLIHNVENVIEKVEPDYVFTHCEDTHQDHVVVSRAVRTACKVKKIKALYYFRNPGSMPFIPTNFVSLNSEDVERKVEAVEKYWMELEDNWEDALYSDLEFYGRLAGVDWAEPFSLVRKMGL